MPDDAIDRARECLARTMEEFGGDARLSCAADIRRDVGNEYWDVPIRAMIAFASQQAPGMVSISQERYDRLRFAAGETDSDPELSAIAGKPIGPIEAANSSQRSFDAAMLDAAPSVTLGEVGK